MSEKQDLKKIEEAEKEWINSIDKDINKENEIEEISKYTADILENNLFAFFEIDNRKFIVVPRIYYNNKNQKSIQLVAREKTHIATPDNKIIKADFVIDKNYTNKENLVTGLKALLGHITGIIKPETLD